MWVTIVIVLVSLLVSYIISGRGNDKTLSEIWLEEHKNNAENRFIVLPSDGHFQKELCEFLEYNGYLSQPLEENFVVFVRENEKYLIRYFPGEGYIQLLKSFEWTDSKREDIACSAAVMTMQYIRCCKVTVDGNTLLFTIDTYIRTLADFTIFLSTYLEIMDAAEQCFAKQLEEMSLKYKQPEIQIRQRKSC